MSKTCYEILVSNEDTVDQVVRLLDEDYHHPHVTIMAFADGHPVDRCLRSKLKKKATIDLTRILLGDHPNSIDERTFFKQLGFILHNEFDGVKLHVPLPLDIDRYENDANLYQSLHEYVLDHRSVIEISMPPLTEIKIRLYLK